MFCCVLKKYIHSLDSRIQRVKFKALKILILSCLNCTISAHFLRPCLSSIPLTPIQNAFGILRGRLFPIVPLAVFE